jgi:hypothetical protein
MVVPVLGGRLDHQARAAWQAPEVLSEGGLMDGTRKLTVLYDAVRGFGGAAASSEIGEADRRQQLVGLHEVGGERHLLFGVGEGPAEAVARARQDSMVTPGL